MKVITHSKLSWVAHISHTCQNKSADLLLLLWLLLLLLLVLLMLLSLMLLLLLLLHVQESGGADLFIGFGGVVERPLVAAGADWYVYEYQRIIDAMRRYTVRKPFEASLCIFWLPEPKHEQHLEYTA
jgi:hypothetical protein